MAKERKSIVCLAAVNVTAIIIAVLVLSFASMPLKAFCSEPCSFVDPFIGTSATGHTFPAACVPFGLVQAGPDTVGREDLWWHYCSGYRFDDADTEGQGEDRPQAARERAEVARAEQAASPAKLAAGGARRF